MAAPLCGGLKLRLKLINGGGLSLIYQGSLVLRERDLTADLGRDHKIRLVGIAGRELEDNTLALGEALNVGRDALADLLE